MIEKADFQFEPSCHKRLNLETVLIFSSASGDGLQGDYQGLI